MVELYDSFNSAKINFDDVYEDPSPLPYFSAMTEIDYRAPHHTLPYYAAIIAKMRSALGKTTLTVLDVGCSYGINAALLRYRIDLDTLYRHYTERGAQDTDPAAADREYFAGLSAREPLTVYGVDRSRPAIDYALRSGLLDAGRAVDLETDTGAPAELGAVDLIISTGCVGYITTRTFAKLLPAAGRPWIACSVLNTLDFAPFEEYFGERDYTTFCAPRLLEQRRISDAVERKQTFASLAALGRDATAVTESDRLLANFYLSAPTGELSTAEIAELWDDVSRLAARPG